MSTAATTVLGIETATELVGTALGDGTRVLAGLWVTGHRRHAETLGPAVQGVLERAGRSLADVDVVAVDVGPGLFTGLRVGVAMAAGLAQGLGAGVLGLGSLEILAAEALGAGWNGEVLAVVDARRGEVFAGRYRRGARGDPVSVAAPRLCRPEELMELVGNASGPPVLAIGDGALRYRWILDSAPSTTVAESAVCGPRPEVLVALAQRRLAEGVVPERPVHLRPTYLRDADVRIGWVTRDPMPAAASPVGTQT